MLSRIRVLVVDDSALIRQMLIRALSLDPRIEVVASAKDGAEAVEKAKEFSPDVITLDVDMPELSGLEALPHILKHSTARVVMLSSADDPSLTYRALSLGAVDFLTKPSTGVASSLTELSEVLLKKIKTAYRVSPDKAQIVAGALSPEQGGGDPLARLAPAVAEKVVACVAIAASTGGPPALERVFSGLTAALPAAYLIVQHLPAGFSESLCKRIERVTDIRAMIAEDGMHLEPGHAYIADYGLHLAVAPSRAEVRLTLSDEAPLHGVRPAADILFSSVSRTFGSRSIGVVLTGMGADGGAGALAIKEVGGATIVQDEETSIVWGMPRAVVRLGAASAVAPIGQVAAEVRRAVRQRIGRSTHV